MAEYWKTYNEDAMRRAFPNRTKGKDSASICLAWADSKENIKLLSARYKGEKKQLFDSYF